MNAKDDLTTALEPFVSPAGIDPRQVDGSRLRWILNERCRKLRLVTAEAYLTYLATNEDEAAQLIDALVVAETRFFRDPAVFTHLRTWAHEFAQRTDRVLQVLSAPCSTGQETYSIAATLAEAGLPPERFTIDAYDISEKALAVASGGVYPTASLRDLTPEQRPSLGSADKTNWCIHPALRARVRFAQGNLAQPGALGAGAQYDLIFCRNLFIYLRPEARANLAGSLKAALKPDGRLVLGSADYVAELHPLFTSVRPAASFAFVHATQPAVVPVASRAKKVTPTPAKRAGRKPQPAALQVDAAAGELAAERTADQMYARALAEKQAGNIRLAERRCRQALYLDSAFLPAMELLESLWHSSTSTRLRKALLGRIERARGSVAGLDVFREPGAVS